jgi:hypothetical protein
MDGIKVKIGGRDIPLRFRMPQFLEIEEEVGLLDDVNGLIIKGKTRARNTISVLRILGNAGLKAAGETPDLTDEWLTENMDPYALKTYQSAVIAAMMEESKSEAVSEENEEKERDLVLEEINAKKGPVNSHTAG